MDLHELSERMLVIEALETARCFDEGVLTSVPDANIGSIFGIGFPAWTGGVVQYVEGFPGGVAGFVARADELRRPVRPALRGPGQPPRPRRHLRGLTTPPANVSRDGRGSKPEGPGTLDTWPTGFSRSSTGWARWASGC